MGERRGEARVEPGRVYATPGALDAIGGAGQTPGDFLGRHLGGDWGELEPEDARLNGEAARTGAGRVFSAYRTRTGERIWVITEHDRSATTLLLPDEY